MQAPAPVETNLRAAFRQRGATGAHAPAINTPARAQRWMQWATAAAAAIATVCAIQAFRLRETPARLLKADNVANLSQMRTPLPADIKAEQINAPTVAKGVEPPRSQQPKNSTRPIERPDYVAFGAKNDGRAPDAKTTAAEQEIMTDFMPLTYGAALSPNEGGQLVRVELPRSALVSLGLPMNVDKLDERVKADVLLGHDGLARAIRFVR
jgi:hypothetical protein